MVAFFINILLIFAIIHQPYAKTFPAAPRGYFCITKVYSIFLGYFVNMLLSFILSTPHNASLNIPPVIFEAPSLSVGEDNRDLNNFIAQFPGSKFHFNLETIAN